MNTKYIFVIGEAVASIDRAVVTASLARLLLSRGLKVNLLKCEPCLNSDFETISNDSEELFVTGDGYMCDFALGYFERFTDVKMSRNNYITTGRILQNVMSRERRGEYAGERVQIVPHATDEVRRCVETLGVSGEYDFVIIELGGNASNVAMAPFVETIKQFREEREEDCVIVNIAIGDETIADFGLPCDVSVDLRVTDDATIYAMPLWLKKQQVDEKVLSATGLHDVQKADLAEWESFVAQLQSVEHDVCIAIVGECTESPLAYVSVKDSLHIAGTRNGVKVALMPLNAEQINDGNAEIVMSGVDGFVIASGKSSRGLEGRIATMKWCRDNDVPTLAIGSGMHSMIIDFARNVLGLREANSTEADARTAHNVIDLMTEQKAYSGMGGAMRLGAYRCQLAEGSQMQKIYGEFAVNERHCHRFEFNNRYQEQLESAGMKCTGFNPETNLVEVVEMSTKRFFVGVQFQPEYNNSVLCPNRLIMDFVRNCVIKK